MTERQITEARAIYAERVAGLGDLSGDDLALRLAGIVAALAEHYAVTVAEMRAALELPPI